MTTQPTPPRLLCPPRLPRPARRVPARHSTDYPTRPDFVLPIPVPSPPDFPPLAPARQDSSAHADYPPQPVAFPLDTDDPKEPR